MHLSSTNSDPLLTREEAAAFLRLKPSTLAAWKSRGGVHLACVKLGSRVMYRLSALQAFIAMNSVGATA